MMESLAISIATKTIQKLLGSVGEEHRAAIEAAARQLEADLEVFVLEQRLRVESFASLLQERNRLYREVWTLVDGVSYEEWAGSGSTRAVKCPRVEELRSKLIAVNRDSGFLFDPTSRGFLLDLRTTCKDCMRVAADRGATEIKWLYPEKDAGFPHGIKLWMTKSALRRAIVRAMMTPESGDQKYFDPDAQRRIRTEVKKTVMSDQRRFIAEEEGSADQVELVQSIFDQWIGKEDSGKLGPR